MECGAGLLELRQGTLFSALQAGNESLVFAGLQAGGGQPPHLSSGKDLEIEKLALKTV